MANRRYFSILLCSSISVFLVSNAPVLAQAPHPFGGITLMKVDNGEVQAVLNHSGYLLTVVAGGQSYVAGGRNVLANTSSVNSTNCVSWIGPERENSGELVVGNGEQWTYRTPTDGFRDREVCSEFTLRRLSAQQAIFARNSLRATLPIIGSYPIVPIDWSDPSISHFRLRGDGLGTITLDGVVEISNRGVARPFSRAQVIENLQRESRMRAKFGGTLSAFRSSWTLDDDSAQISFNGLINVDRLIAEGQAEVPYARFLVTQKDLIPKSLFEQGLLTRYGPPTARLSGEGLQKWFTLIWAHDLQGRLLTEDEGSIDAGFQALVDFGYSIRDLNERSDMGAWGFGLVMSVTVPGILDEVDSYSVYIRHAHALAHQLFSGRLQEISEIRQALESESQESFVPEF
jgi:hypothetical protein